MLTICNEIGCNGGVINRFLPIVKGGILLEGVFCNKCGRIHQEKKGGIKIPVYTQDNKKIFYNPVLETIVLIRPKIPEEKKKK